MSIVRRALLASLTFTVFAGLIQPAAAVPSPVRAAVVVDADPAAPRPMPPDPYKEWDGKAGVPNVGDPRFRQLVADNAELAEDAEVRDAAKAALAGGQAAIMAFLDTGLNEAKAKAAARKAEQARQDRAAIEPLRGTGGPYLKAEVDRVLAGTDSDRAQFLVYGKGIAEQRDAATTQSARDRADQNRARVQLLVGVAGPEVKKAAQLALNAGDQAIEQFLATGYLVAAKKDADAREQFLKDEEERQKAAEAVSDLAKRSARANEARRLLLVAHGNGVRALQRSSNALVLAGNEARKAAQILAANKAGGQHPLDAFNGVKAEVARQLGYSRQAATDAQQASAQAQVQANVLVETGLPYGTQWAQMAYGMANAAQAAVSASETASNAIDATAFTDQARNAQEEAERHAAEAHKWRLHAEEHARAAAQLAEAAKVQADAAKDAAARTKASRQAAEAAEAQAWAAAERTRNARITAEREAANAAAARAVAERERANAAAARGRAEQQAAVARAARGEAEFQAGIAARARQSAEAQDGIAAGAETGARNEERNAAQARDRAYQAERDQRAAEARAAALEAMAAAGRGSAHEGAARDAAAAARMDADTAKGAAGAARGAANTATGAAAGARSAATEATRAAARARAAANQAQAAAARANAAANKAEAEAAATHAAAERSNAAAADATFSEAQAAEAARNAVSLAERAASEAVQALQSAERTKAESEAASAEAVSAATQATLAVQSATAARASSQAITEPANTAITVVAPFSGADIDADFVILVANQARAVGAEQAAAAQQRANEAVEAARLAGEAAARAAAEVKPAYDAAAAAARSSADAAKSAAEAQKAAAEAAADGAAARSAAARANQADAQARQDAILARKAANAANNDAAIAGRAASAAEHDAAAARSAASQAEADAAAARGAADRAEADAVAADAAATSAQKHADAAAEAAKNAMNSAIDAGKAADRAEEAARKAEEERRKREADGSDDAGPQPTSEDIDALFSEGGEELVNEYKAAQEQAKKGIIDFILQQGGEVLLDLIGYTDAKKCFGEGDVAACLWTVVNVGSLLAMVAKLPAVSSAIAKIVGGLTRFLEGTQAGKRFLEAMRGMMGAAKTRCVDEPNSFTPDTPVKLAGGGQRPIKDVKVGDLVMAGDPIKDVVAPRPVTEVIIGIGKKDLVSITVDTDGPSGARTGKIDATAGHPFWVESRKLWLEARYLQAGDQVRDIGGEPLLVTAVKPRTEYRKVYNLTVEGMHTFYVAAADRAVLVHNLACLIVLKDFANSHMQFGNGQFLLDKKGMDHFLTRHHKQFWDGTVKKEQTFFREGMSVGDVESAIKQVMAQNRDKLAGRGPNGMYQIEGTVDGITYKLGINNGRIGQFYPKP
ncbi:polymorphic toxin-type HINT domain-containing protein [Amycolatopsis sp. cg5]|uniref:polymorphic toxin-type HINT domain-containing protein n=1 Tax=Amycolatopsis sp. cg5 TaxID=3238802 RepID=UPI0035266731